MPPVLRLPSVARSSPTKRFRLRCSIRNKLGMKRQRRWPRSDKPVAPSEWSQLILTPESAVAIAFAAGNFPQMVRDLPRLARAATQPTPPVESGAAAAVDGLDSWLSDCGRRADRLPDCSWRPASFRLARQFDRAEQILQFAIAPT